MLSANPLNKYYYGPPIERVEHTLKHDQLFLVIKHYHIITLTNNLSKKYTGWFLKLQLFVLDRHELVGTLFLPVFDIVKIQRNSNY